MSVQSLLCQTGKVDDRNDYRNDERKNPERLEERKKEMNKTRTVKMQDVIKRRQILIKLAENIPTDELNKYKLTIKHVALVTKKHVFKRMLIFSCPVCSEGVVEPYSFFCPNCGTKLRWSKGAPHGD